MPKGIANFFKCSAGLNPSRDRFLRYPLLWFTEAIALEELCFMYTKFQRILVVEHAEVWCVI